MLLGAYLPLVTWQEKRNLSRYLGGSQGAGRRGSSLIQLQVIVPQRRFLAVKILWYICSYLALTQTQNLSTHTRPHPATHAVWCVALSAGTRIDKKSTDIFCLKIPLSPPGDLFFSTYMETVFFQDQVGYVIMDGVEITGLDTWSNLSFISYYVLCRLAV